MEIKPWGIFPGIGDLQKIPWRP